VTKVDLGGGNVGVFTADGKMTVIKYNGEKVEKD